MYILYPDEEFKEFTFPHKLRKRYAVSNYGRLLSFNINIKDGTILRGSSTDGYRVFRYKIFNNGVIKNYHIFVYKLVAENFLEKENPLQDRVIHLDYKRDNDVYTNLKWVTKEEQELHHKNSPFVKQSIEKLTEYNKKREGQKLTSTDVIRLKKQLAKPNRNTRNKILAKRFNISETQLLRIIRGENWGHIQI